MSAIDFRRAKYAASATTLAQLPADRGCEVAFIGRSNAGKSSALNSISGIKNLARVSKTPGRTQMINFFNLDQTLRLVDLPGYGYANVPRMLQQRWSKTVDDYLQTRQSLCGLVLVMDIRHPLRELDQKLIAWTLQCGIPLHVLLTKSDKLSKQAARNTLNKVTQTLQAQSADVSVQIFSSHDRTGLETAREQLMRWLTDCCAE